MEPQTQSPEIQTLLQQMAALQSRVTENERIIGVMRSNLNNPRVRIQNFEGVFKMVSIAPSNSDDYQDGSILVYFDGATTYRIYAKINKTWRYATLT